MLVSSLSFLLSMIFAQTATLPVGNKRGTQSIKPVGKISVGKKSVIIDKSVASKSSKESKVERKILSKSKRIRVDFNNVHYRITYDHSKIIFEQHSNRYQIKRNDKNKKDFDSVIVTLENLAEKVVIPHKALEESLFIVAEDGQQRLYPNEVSTVGFLLDLPELISFLVITNAVNR